MYIEFPSSLGPSILGVWFIIDFFFTYKTLERQSGGTGAKGIETGLGNRVYTLRGNGACMRRMIG